MVKKIALIVAAGNGTRMGSATPKQFLLLQNKPVLWHTIAAFQNSFEDIEILLVVGREHFSTTDEIRKTSARPLQIQLIQGGETRFESVCNGLHSIIEKNAIIFVHDGVRCLVSGELIKTCFREAERAGSAVPIISVQDTLRMRSGNDFKVIDRDKISIIQTPQTFRANILLSAFRETYDECFTDESMVEERTGETVHFIPGEDLNIKITRPVDLLLAEAILAERK